MARSPWWKVRESWSEAPQLWRNYEASGWPILSPRPLCFLIRSSRDLHIQCLFFGLFQLGRLVDLAKFIHRNRKRGDDCLLLVN